MTNRYDWGIYSGIKGIPWDRTEKEVNVRTNVLYMLNRSLGMFRYTGLPDTIKPYDLERLLQTNGYGVFTKDDKGDLYAFYGGLGGMYNAYGQPTQATISNPWLKFNKTVDLMGDEAVLMRNDFMMMGLVPIYSKYSTLMVENEITMVLAGYTKRVNHIISANDDNTADSARNFLKKVEDGEVGFITETKLFDSLKTNPFGGGTNNNFSDLIEMQQYLKASMYNEIGLDANFNMKRERLNSAEVEMNSDALYPLVDQMLQSRRDALDEINSTFGTEITVEFNSSWDYRVNQGEPINTEGAGMGDLSSVPTVVEDGEQGIENIIEEEGSQDEQDGTVSESDSQGTGDETDGDSSERDSEVDTQSDRGTDEDSSTDDVGTDEQQTDEDSRDTVDTQESEESEDSDKSEDESDDETDENEDAAKDETEDKEDESDDEEDEEDDKEDKK